MRAFLPALALLAATPAFAQAPAIPRAADGHPDLEGFWASHHMTPLERPEGIAGLVVPRDELDAVLEKIIPKIPDNTDPELVLNPFPRALLEMNGELRSSMITTPEDGKLPLTALAQAVVNKYKNGFDNPEDRPGPERCIDSFNHPPLMINNELVPHQFVQTPHALVLTTEDLDPGRIVALDGPVPPDSVRSLAGYARGRWESDTLIVTTDHIAVADLHGIVWRGGALVTADSRIIERFSLLSADLMLYQFTIEDPSLFKAPWSAEYTMTRTTRPVWEYACHEGNHAIFNILSAARMGRQEPKPADDMPKDKDEKPSP